MRRLTVLLVLIVLFFVGFFVWYSVEKIPVNSLDHSQKTFVIRNGEGIRDIVYNLKKQGFIRSPIAFFLLIKQLGLEGKIQAGIYTLSPALSSPAVAESLTHGTNDVWITIPEGKRAEEISDILKEKMPTYADAWTNQLRQEEGYLFPDTYRFPANADISDIIAIMKNNFESKYLQAAKMQTNNLSEADAVILASIVEREAISPRDKQLVASTLENRLAIGMALGSDVTIEYALGYQPKEKTWWKKDLTTDDLQIDSPYNTRITAGLPPTPISNPGLISLEAVLHPPHTNYLYYVSDSKGVLHFATTLEEHNVNVAKYNN